METLSSSRSSSSITLPTLISSARSVALDAERPRLPRSDGDDERGRFTGDAVGVTLCGDGDVRRGVREAGALWLAPEPVRLRVPLPLPLPPLALREDEEGVVLATRAAARALA